MKKKKQIKVLKKSKINVLAIILISGALGFFILSYYLINEGLQDVYPQIYTIGLGVFFLLFGVGCLYSLYVFEKDENDVFDKKKELKIENKNLFFMFFKQIKLKYYFAAPFFILGLFSLYASYNFYVIKDDELLYSDLTTLKDVITNKVEIISSGRGSKLVSICLKKHPEFLFQISGVAFSAFDAGNYIRNVNQGDTISLSILTDEFQKKISKERELGFNDKYSNYGIIRFYSLSDKNFSYLDIYDYNIENRKNNSFAIWMYGLFDFFLIGVSIYLINLKEREQLKN